MNIAIIGTGGVGGFYGGKLALRMGNEPDLDVYFVARNRHLEEIRTHGLMIDTDGGTYVCHPTLATDDIAALPAIDVCMVCVKGYDLIPVMQQLCGKITSSTLVLPLLNGVDIYERIRTVVSDGIVFPACAYVATHIERPGKITQRGGSGVIHFGEDPAYPGTSDALLSLFTRAGIRYNYTQEPYFEIWKKFLFIAAYGLVTAAYNKSIDQVLASDELSGHVKECMDEIVLLAEKRGVPLAKNDAETAYLKGGTFPPGSKTSFQRDYEIIGTPDERDVFGGTILRLGKEMGVAVDTTQCLCTMLDKGKPVTW